MQSRRYLRRNENQHNSNGSGVFKLRSAIMVKSKRGLNVPSLSASESSSHQDSEEASQSQPDPDHHSQCLPSYGDGIDCEDDYPIHLSACPVEPPLELRSYGRPLELCSCN
ncbi:hypothetical protein Mapa_011284 [Marchantia paleacea]|nr:hypothetical protein Mapa_011284 [Marchantia paleacea]